ncbi:GntR family transcriptional regulator [Jannaschia seohaensis]|uniref:DNA-binding GntR family transcriptional regulator n=1 Tax=Jannaschia seohaensis TaxID=475081 RepID=A0A2Y9B1J8_9RHOB|nr:GntR family transcriptional regulator [Jannaschia seohaensis]PWJ13861.1 DNA-binding GntR family transcriptional regulator [Jannaschia seohaensis]SSA50374.1 DNA-binding transcriptional regulator, GntR family [Jannaschia seohaensis]
MARSQRTFRLKYNEALDFLAAGGRVESISGFARKLAVSRTTARSLIQQLRKRGLLDSDQGPLQRPVHQSDYYPRSQVLETTEILRSAFMNWIIREQLRPGHYVDEAQIATQLQIPMSNVREFLIGLSKFGFFRKHRGREWRVEPITRDFIGQMLNLRRMLEVNSVAPLVGLPHSDPFWPTLQSIRTRHVELLQTVGGETLPFVELDNRFHSLLNSASENRIMQVLQEAVFFIFHFHYRWGSSEEKARNEQAMVEHLQIIDALIERDSDRATSALIAHLSTAQNTLVASLENPSGDIR